MMLTSLPAARFTLCCKTPARSGCFRSSRSRPQMRIRVLGQYVPASIAVLALVEALFAFLAMYAAVLIRFETPIVKLHQLEQHLGPLWPRALVFAATVTV